MQDRLIVLIDHVADPRQPWSDLQAKTGISGQRWRSAYRRSQRPTSDMLEAIAKNWPQYVCWLVAGSVDIATCQMAPSGVDKPQRMKDR